MSPSSSPSPSPSPDDAGARPPAGGADAAGAAGGGTGEDPVLVQRRRVARLASWGQRAGYALFALFGVLVAVGFPTGFPPVVTTGAIVAIVVGSALLAPAIVASYAVKAAEREDREGDWR